MRFIANDSRPAIGFPIRYEKGLSLSIQARTTIKAILMKVERKSNSRKTFPKSYPLPSGR